MEITVNEQTQRFYLAFNTWEPVVGHEIKVGKYSFCAIPLRDCINVSEVTSGVKVLAIPINSNIMMLTGSKEGAIKFFYKIGESLNRILGSTENIDEQIEKMKKLAFEKLGEMPSIENVDTDWILEDVSEVLN